MRRARSLLGAAQTAELNDLLTRIATRKPWG
jgi:hypothetical protein